MLHYLERFIDLVVALIPQKKPNQLAAQTTCLIAHRGAHNQATGVIENTLNSFRHALKLGCWGIEFDVHTTADNILVVHHDASLQRLWGIKQFIQDVSFAELKTLVPQIPSLEEVVSEFGKHLHLFIELKSPLIKEQILIDHLKHLKAETDYHLLALKVSLFTNLNRFPKSSLLLVPSVTNAQQFCKISIKNNYGGVLGHYLLLTRKRVYQLLAANQSVGVGFVDYPNSLYREINRGIHWLFTNNAYLMTNELKKLNSP